MPNKQKEDDDRKIVAGNRKAYHDYHILEHFEAGIALTGTEIKSVRSGHANIREAYAKFEGKELWLYNSNIAKYLSGSYYNHDPLRRRKLLMHKSQLLNLRMQLERKGLTLIPLNLYIRDHHAKVELALAQGKKQYDKRQAIIQRDMDREAQRAVRAANR